MKIETVWNTIEIIFIIFIGSVLALPWTSHQGHFHFQHQSHTLGLPIAADFQKITPNSRTIASLWKMNMSQPPPIIINLMELHLKWIFRASFKNVAKTIRKPYRKISYHYANSCGSAYKTLSVKLSNTASSSMRRSTDCWKESGKTKQIGKKQTFRITS